MVTEYQFFESSFSQINTFYSDAQCEVLNDADFENPLVVDGEYSFFDVAATASGIDINLYEFTFFSVAEGVENNEGIYGIYIENDILYWAYESAEGDYIISFDYPYYLVQL